MNRLTALALALAVILVASASSQAAERGQVSNSTLAKMGFATANSMSDAEGLNIRGLGVPVALAAGHQVAHGASTALVINVNIAITGSRKASAFSLGVAVGNSF